MQNEAILKKYHLKIFSKPITVGLYYNAFLSNCSVVMPPYDQDMWGAWAVPSSRKKCFLLKMELIHFRHNSSASIIQRVGGNCYSLASKAFFTAWRPGSLSILGNMFTMSNLNKIQFSIRILLSFKKSIKLSISDVSWTLLSSFKTSGHKHFSTNIDKFSTAVPRPPVMTLTGLSALCALTKPCFFPVSTNDGSINLLQLFYKTLFSVHFWIHKFTFSENNLDGLWSSSSNELFPNWYLIFST